MVRTAAQTLLVRVLRVVLGAPDAQRAVTVLHLSMEWQAQMA